MESQSFYYDEQHSRTIKLEWTKDCGQVTIYDNDQILHQHSDVGQLKKGIVIRSQKGENLYIRLFMDPVRWQVSFGDRMLINSYNRSEEVVKGTSQIFYYVFLASVIYLMLLFLPQYKAGMIGLDILLTPTMLIYIGLIVVFYLCGMLVRRGKLTWYYIGTSLYLIDTVYVLLNSFVISEISISALFQTNLGLILFALLLIRIVFAYYLIKAFPDAVEYAKHVKSIKKRESSELLDS